MWELDRCQNGSEDCGFSEPHELALIAKIMGVIRRFGEEQNIAHCPLCLRDTMLAVAALLHLEGVRTVLARPGKPQDGGACIHGEFKQAACERLESVIVADAHRIARGKH